MGRTKDRALIFDAAENWANELTEYIVPGVLTKQERKHYRKQADRLNNAIHRERERARRKRERDERRAATGPLIAIDHADGSVTTLIPGGCKSDDA